MEGKCDTGSLHGWNLEDHEPEYAACLPKTPESRDRREHDEEADDDKYCARLQEGEPDSRTPQDQDIERTTHQKPYDKR